MAQIKATAAKNAITPVDRTPSGRLPAVVAEAGREHTDQPAGPCPRYRDCVDTTPGHHDHYNHGIRVTADDGDILMDAGMAALSNDTNDRPVVYIRNTDYGDAASVHAATARLRQRLDEVDALADRVFADHEKRG